MFQPWQIIRDLPITIHWRRKPGVLGETNGTDTIYLHPDQSQAQRRCTLTHELAHITLGHTDGCTSREEHYADILAAQWLIPLPDLINALKWTENPVELAEELTVDQDTLATRLKHLTPEELTEIHAHLGEH